MTIEGLAISG